MEAVATTYLTQQQKTIATSYLTQQPRTVKLCHIPHTNVLQYKKTVNEKDQKKKSPDKQDYSPVSRDVAITSDETGLVMAIVCTNVHLSYTTSMDIKSQ